MKIEFVVPAVPVAQPRQRTRIIPGQSFAHNFTPAKHPVNAFKATARQAFAAAYSGPPLTGPVSLTAEYVFPRPKNLQWKTRPMPRERHAKKPDRDNCEKALKDALSGLAWIDDCQVCAGEPTKWVAAGDEQPHVLVRIEELNGAE